MHMPKHSLLYPLLVSFCITACTEKTSVAIKPESLHGLWVRENDLPGREPADTLAFFSKNGQNMLSFYSAGSPGPDWPEHAETEYRLQNNKLGYRNYFGGDNAFFEVKSFEWVTPEKSFSVRLHEVLRFMSADYRVTYRKLER